MTPIERFARWLLAPRRRACEMCGNEYAAARTEYRRTCSEECATALWVESQI